MIVNELVVSFLKSRRTWAAVVLFTTLNTSVAFAADEAHGIKGVWRGPWYLGMSSGTGSITITSESPLEGTLQLINNDTFGEAAVPITDAKFDGALLSFRAKGADGRMLSGQLPVTVDSKAMKGFVKYGGYNVKFEFVRQP